MQVMRHLADHSVQIQREFMPKSGEDEITRAAVKLVDEMLANETVRLWISMQVAKLTGRVH
jgi:hypothetical protein